MEKLPKINIIYEDNHLLVVEKPVNIPVQEDISQDIDMITLLKKYRIKKENKKGDAYIGLVHRLDRPVGGIMVFAKTSKAASRISNYIREKNFKKRYLAIINGKIEKTNKSVTLHNYLVKNQRLNMSKVCDKNTKGAKEAILEYSVLNNFNFKGKDYTKVDINLKTGRHHQIRVQFANILHPLYGDIKYGNKINKVGQNLALWSYYLSFFHPTKDEYLEFTYYPTQLKNHDKIWEEC